MAQLTSAQKDAVAAQIMREFCAAGVEIPVMKTALRTLLDTVDPQLEAAEASILAALPSSPGKTWLQAHPQIARLIVADVEEKRAEVL